VAASPGELEALVFVILYDRGAEVRIRDEPIVDNVELKVKREFAL